MSNLNSWEDDPAAQDENLAQQAQQMNLGNNQGQPQFRPGAATFSPGAAAFQPGQAYGGGYGMPQYQQGYYGSQQQGFYPQYGGQQPFNQYGQGGYGNVYGQGQYNNQGYGKHSRWHQVLLKHPTDFATPRPVPRLPTRPARPTPATPAAITGPQANPHHREASH